MTPPPFTVIGTPFSTFTRTYKGITFSQVDLKLRESQAIASDQSPTLTIAVVAEQMWEFVSFVGAYGFPALEKVKPRVAATNQATLSDAEICRTIAPAVAQLRAFLDKIETHMSPEGYVFGEKLSWADLFLYPLLVDLRAIPEGEILSPWLVGWMDKMDQLDAVEKTRADTLSVGARPLSSLVLLGNTVTSV
ncbi:hypothetical protein JVT61DRAFT_9143 [Boletus reticuloceps]|uniref:GST C-terminal domain-containing protein n=1 Tax=Boletus reticuloceps TaxID=495285 RepID=A0A8I2YI58_9AGAM|nr:hypothetical protein JVT61DRAFT_9143 [Boletus reticuloceps]